MRKYYPITIKLVSAITLAVFLSTQITPGYALDSVHTHSHIRAQAAGETSVAKGIGEDLHPKKQSTVSKFIAKPVPHPGLNLSPATDTFAPPADQGAGSEGAEAAGETHIAKGVGDELVSSAKASADEPAKGLCVTGDTFLAMADGNHKYIVDVKAGDYVLSLNEATQKIEPHRIKGLLDMGVKPVYKLTTR